MDVDAIVFGALTLLMALGSVVMILGVSGFGDVAVWAGGGLLVASIMLMARQVAVLDEPEHAGESGH